MHDFGVKLCNNCNLYFRNYVTKYETEAIIQKQWLNKEGKFERWKPKNIYGYSYIKNCLTLQTEKIYPKDKRLKILDVGLGEGSFIKLFTKEHITYGLEVNPITDIKYEEIINGSMIYCDVEKTVSFKHKSYFDVLTAMDIFEHFVCPQTAITNLKYMLRKNGILMLETANINCLPAIILGHKTWWYLSVLEHKVFWDIKSIKTFLRKNGFKILQIKKKVHKGGCKLELLEYLKYFMHFISPKIYYYIMKKLNKSNLQPMFPWVPWKDHMLVIAQKK